MRVGRETLSSTITISLGVAATNLFFRSELDGTHGSVNKTSSLLKAQLSLMTMRCYCYDYYYYFFIVACRRVVKAFFKD